MLPTAKMNQESGDNSQNTQIITDTTNVYNGLSYTEVEKVALAVFRDNFIKLSEDAMAVALARVEGFVSDFLEKAQTRLQDTSVFLDVGFQSTLYKAQCAHAQNGDDEVKERLIETLLDRAEEKNRSSKQVLLDEVLDVLPKLSTSDINTLTLFFVLTRPDYISVSSFQDFENVIGKISDLYTKSDVSNKNIKFLEYLKILSTMEKTLYFKPLEEIFQGKFGAAFSLGFTPEEFTIAVGGNFDNFVDMMIPHRSGEKVQFKALNKQALVEQLNEVSDADLRAKIIQFYEKTIMPAGDVEDFLVEIDGRMSDLLIKWKDENSVLKHKDLSPIGLLIASMNFNKVFGVNIKVM